MTRSDAASRLLPPPGAWSDREKVKKAEPAGPAGTRQGVNFLILTILPFFTSEKKYCINSWRLTP